MSGVVYEEVARVPDRVGGGELVRWQGHPPDGGRVWTWWTVQGDLGAVTYLERRDMPGDFGVHYPPERAGTTELLQECQFIEGDVCCFQPIASVGEAIDAEIAGHTSGPDDELAKLAVIWGLLSTIYYAFFHGPVEVEG